MLQQILHQVKREVEALFWPQQRRSGSRRSSAKPKKRLGRDHCGDIESHGLVTTLDQGLLRPIEQDCPKCEAKIRVDPWDVIAGAVTGTFYAPAGSYEAQAIYGQDGRLLSISLIRR